MAKGNKRVKQNRQKRKVLVRSKRYGDHERNPRGTFKPAVLNDAMVASKNRLLQVNQTASLIFNSIRDEHKDGTLWPRLLSAFRHQLKEKNNNDVLCLLNLECHAGHTLSNLIRSYWFVDPVTILKRQMTITMELNKAPVYRAKALPAFQVSFHVIYPDLSRNRVKKESAYSNVFSRDDFSSELRFEIPVPPHATSYAVFLKITECVNGEPKNWLHTTGMRCVAVGIIENRKKAAGGAVAAKEKSAGQQKNKGKATHKTSEKIKRKGS